MFQTATVIRRSLFWYRAVRFYVRRVASIFQLKFNLSDNDIVFIREMISFTRAAEPIDYDVNIVFFLNTHHLTLVLTAGFENRAIASKLSMLLSFHGPVFIFLYVH